MRPPTVAAMHSSLPALLVLVVHSCSACDTQRLCLKRAMLVMLHKYDTSEIMNIMLFMF